MYNLFLGFKFAFAYFSILPMRFKRDDDLSKSEVLGAMLFFFPLVGYVLMGLSIFLFTLLNSLDYYGAIFASVVYLILYGFLHTEAILDVADAIYASHSGKDAYSVIKDSTVGAMGVLWSVAILILKVAGVSYALLHHLFGFLLVVAILSRFSLLVLFFTQEFRSTFLEKLKEGFTKQFFIWATLIYSIVGFLTLGLNFFYIVAVALTLAFLIAKWIEKRVGFINGDVLGATLEGVEVLVVLFGALLWH